MDEALSPRIRLTPTVSAFIQSPVDIVVLMGPRGEGKSVGGMAGILYHAARQEARPVKWAVVRDTWVNVERTVLETIREGVRDGWWTAEFKRGGEQVILNGGLVKLYCFGMDTMADASRFQGLELAGLWIDEAAPAAELSGGVPVTVVQMAMSSARQRGVDRPRVQITMNAPDEDHWTMHLRDHFAEPLTCDVFHIPAEENVHLPAGYRAKMAAAFQDRPDLYARMVEGKPSVPVLGEPLVSTFDRARHVSPTPLKVYSSLPMIRAWDAGAGDLHPAVVFMQFHRNLGLNILASRVAENVGIEEFVIMHVRPLMEQYGWLPARSVLGGGFGAGDRGGFEFRDIGDPAMLVMSGISSQLTVAKHLAKILGASVEPGPVDWMTRREALLTWFRRSAPAGQVHDRKALVQIDPEENAWLIRGLAGRCHYPKDETTGRIIGTLEALKRASGLYGHLLMALAYAQAVLMPPEEWIRAAPQSPTKPYQPPKSWLGA